MPTASSDYGLVLTGDDATPAIPFLLGANSGITIDSITYTGALDALRLVETAFNISGPNGGFTIPSGVFLSSGGTPGTSNTQSGFSVTHGTAGDADLDATAVQAFPNAGSTQDAAVLEFTFDTPAPGTLSFQAAFGSDEFPEFSNSTFVDIAAVYVNGTNYALFNSDPAQPLSIIDTNLSLGNFVDNTDGAYGVEYDGFAPSLQIFAPVVAGTNTVKIAIADTGDTILDSGLQVSNLTLGAAGAQGTFVPVFGSDGPDNITGSVAPESFALGDGNDVVAPGLGNDAIDIGGGANTIIGSLADLNGDVISNFGDDDTINYDGAFFTTDNLTVEQGSAILTVDANGDGVGDATTTLTGEFSNATFSTTQTGSGTQVNVAFGALSDEVLQGGLEALYDAVFNRAPDGDGFAFWSNILTSGELTLPEVSDFFVTSEEFVTTFGAPGPQLSTDQIVTIGYQNVLNRDPDPAGAQFWSNQLTSNQIDEGDFFAFLATSEELQAQANTSSNLFADMF